MILLQVWLRTYRKQPHGQLVVCRSYHMYMHTRKHGQNVGWVGHVTYWRQLSHVPGEAETKGYSQQITAFSGKLGINDYWRGNKIYHDKSHNIIIEESHWWHFFSMTKYPTMWCAVLSTYEVKSYTRPIWMVYIENYLPHQQQVWLFIFDLTKSFHLVTVRLISSIFVNVCPRQEVSPTTPGRNVFDIENGTHYKGAPF